MEMKSRWLGRNKHRRPNFQGQAGPFLTTSTADTPSHYSMALVFKAELGCTPWPTRNHSRELSTLDNHPTFFPGTIQRQKKKQKLRQKQRTNTLHQPLRSIDHLTPEEQVRELRHSRQAIESNLYSRIARLQVCRKATTPL